VPVALAAATVRAATHAAGGAPARAVTLSEGVLRAMFAAKVRRTLAILLTLGLVAAGAVALAQTRGAVAQAPREDNAEADRARLQGEWVFDSAESGEALDGRQQDLIS